MITSTEDLQAIPTAAKERREVEADEDAIPRIIAACSPPTTPAAPPSSTTYAIRRTNTAYYRVRH